ncbi:hypothetical protein CY35_09G080000 [Sphagnum magellanicum]|nr:hypothetical protein CY35_09G080000 [Sphagnum magellanicum]
MSTDNQKGLALAVSSSLFIGASFIIKKKGLKRAGATGIRAGVGGYSYLYEPLWWAGMITMLVGEVANFTAYAFAPAVLVTPLGALSIIVSAVLAHIVLKERLHTLGIVGCVLCIVGSTTIVLHAPKEQTIDSVEKVWGLATEPAFLLYTMAVIALVLLLIFHYVPQCGHTHVLVYIAICSLMGSLSVMSVKALGIALKLTFQGQNQLIYPQTSVFAMVVVTCVLTQMNYLNKDWDQQSASQIITELCGFVTILSGTFLLHATKDIGDSSSTMAPELDSTVVGCDWFEALRSKAFHLKALTLDALSWATPIFRYLSAGRRSGGLYGGLPITSMPNRLSMSAHVKRPEDTMENEEIPLRRTDSLRTP